MNEAWVESTRYQAEGTQERGCITLQQDYARGFWHVCFHDYTVCTCLDHGVFRSISTRQYTCTQLQTPSESQTETDSLLSLGRGLKDLGSGSVAYSEVVKRLEADHKGQAVTSSRRRCDWLGEAKC